MPPGHARRHQQCIVGLPAGSGAGQLPDPHAGVPARQAGQRGPDAAAPLAAGGGAPGDPPASAGPGCTQHPAPGLPLAVAHVSWRQAVKVMRAACLPPCWACCVHPACPALHTAGDRPSSGSRPEPDYPALSSGLLTKQGVSRRLAADITTDWWRATQCPERWQGPLGRPTHPG